MRPRETVLDLLRTANAGREDEAGSASIREGTETPFAAVAGSGKGGGGGGGGGRGEVDEAVPMLISKRR